MTSSLLRLPFISLVLAGLILASPSARADALKIDLAAHRVVVAADGTETKVVAEAAAPGEVIEYSASYKNTTEVVLRNIRPEVPIPAGLTYVSGSDKPAATQVRLDTGAVVAHPAVDAEGRPLPAARVRALIWTLDDLPASATRTLAVRASVNR